MFLDEAIIDVSGGSGGDGSISWRREKYVPKGGPDGGNGGKGGDVYLHVNENIDTLSFYASQKRFEAEKGDRGHGQNKAGHGGKDMALEVPVGTIVKRDSTIIADLSTNDESIVVAKGGRGGYGNAHFKSSVRQRPDFAEKGEPGEKYTLALELKLVADIGIIGLPSVGKSTLISAMSSARPKIAAYPFTTLVPNLGVVTAHERSYVVCDVPGLIEGASDGKGLGDQFLKHIERCGILLHVLDCSRDDLVTDYKTLRHELEAYSPALIEKRELVVLNKADLMPEDDLRTLQEMLQDDGIAIFATLSAQTRQGTQNLSEALLPLVLSEREKRETEELSSHSDATVLMPHKGSMDMSAFELQKQPDGSIIIRGKRLEQLTIMTDFQQNGAVQRYLDILDKIGLKKRILKEISENNAPVYVGDTLINDVIRP